jgi:hypothetical protein
MKKFVSILSSLAIIACASTSYADVKVGGTPQQGYNGEDYVGEIVASTYEVRKDNQPQSIVIMTVADKDLNASNLPALTLVITDKDLPLGLSLADAVGKKLAIAFSNANYEISYVSVVTPKYWNGSKKK